MKSYDYQMVNTDTDAIMICKPDQSPWTKEEQEKFLNELNAQFPELITFEHDGVFESVIVVKAKNYILLPEGETEVELKGSSIKDQKKEPAMLEMMKKIINEMVYENRIEVIREIYKTYVKEALNVEDISRWSQKKTITESITNCEKTPGRKQEQDVWNAVKMDNYQQGDKVFVYPTILGKNIVSGRISEKTGKPLKDKEEIITGLKQVKDWNNDHNIEHLLKRCYATLKIFKNVLDMDTFMDYSKKSNKKMLEDI